MGTMLDRQRLAEITNQQAYLDNGAYGNAYMASVLAAAQAQCVAYLRFDPTLSVHTDETGLVDFMSSGPWRGRYLIDLRHRPLIPGDAATVFSDLHLTYSLGLIPPSAVPLDQAEVENSSGRAFVLAPGFIEALAPAIGFSFGATSGLRATGYKCTYVSGYACGIADITPEEDDSYNAPPLPEDMRLACAYLAQERIMVDSARAASPTNPFASYLTGVRVGERSETYAATKGAGSVTVPLGYGTPLAASAQAILDQYRKYPAPVLI